MLKNLFRRQKILEHNQQARAGLAPVRRLDEGEVVFKIPDEDVKVLRVIYPELFSKDHKIRLAAWKKFRHNPVAEKYLVTRTPRQVRASNNRIIVK